jgi:hypothetical protein
MPKDNLIGNLETSVADKMKKKATGGKPSRNINVGGSRSPVKNVNVGGSRGQVKDKIVRIGGKEPVNNEEYMPGSLAKPSGNLAPTKDGDLIKSYYIPNPRYKPVPKKDVKKILKGKGKIPVDKRPIEARSNIIEVPSDKPLISSMRVRKGKWVKDPYANETPEMRNRRIDAEIERKIEKENAKWAKQDAKSARGKK